MFGRSFSNAFHLRWKSKEEQTAYSLTHLVVCQEYHLWKKQHPKLFANRDPLLQEI